MEFGFEPVCDQVRAGSSYLDLDMSMLEACRFTQTASPIGPPVGPMPYTAGALWELAICACRQWAFSGSPWLPYYETAHAPKRTF